MLIGSIGVIAALLGRQASRAALAPDKDAELVELSRKLNTSLPSMVDAETRLDQTSAALGQQCSYYYTFANHPSTNIDLGKLLATLGPLMHERVCKTPETRALLKDGVTLNYIDRGNDNVELTRLAYTLKDCG